MSVPYQNGTVNCIPKLRLSTFMHICLIPSVVIIVIFSALHRRQLKCWRFSWRPGIVVPANFLDGYKNRWAYAAAFGATSNRLLILLTHSDQYWGSELQAPRWIQRSFLLILAILEISVVFFPLFACLTTRYKLVGAIFGSSYSLVWCTVQMMYMLDCPEDIDTTSFFILPISYSKLIYQWPSALFLLIMVAKFLHMIWTCLRSGQCVDKDVEPLAMPHHVTYVRCLLEGQLPDKIESADLEDICDTFAYKSVPGFLYPTRMLCVLFVTISLSYQLVLGVVYSSVQITQQLVQLAQTLALLNSTTEGEKISDFLQGSMIVGVVCSWVTAVLLICLLVGSVFLIFKNYRRHMLQLCRGDQSFVPCLDRTAPRLMASSMRWAGYQIAYLLWGLFIFFLTVFLFLFAIVEAVYAIVCFDAWNGVESMLSYIGPPFAMNIIIYYSQVIWSRIFFLQPKPELEESQPLAIDNRKAFETANYFTFFINIAIGLFSTIYRLFLSLVTGLITLGRMDQSILKKGYERIDKGHGAYIGMLFVDYTHNHPVLRVFCDELIAARDGSQHELPIVTSDIHAVGYGSFVSSHAAGFGPQRSRSGRLAKMWQLTYTLLNNPDLIQFRKHNLGRRRPSFGSSVQSWSNGEYLSLKHTKDLRTNKGRPEEPSNHQSCRNSIEV